MATISSVGIGSGLDVNSIVSQLVALEKTPLTSLAVKATNVKAQISAFGEIQSQFAALTDVASRISVPSTWGARNATSSNASAATITATGTANAASFRLDVDQLAKVQSVSSGQFTTGAAVGAGTLTLRIGSWTQSTDATKAAATVVYDAAVAALVPDPDNAVLLAAKDAALAAKTALDAGRPSFGAASGGSDVGISVTSTDTVATVAAKINSANTGVVATAFNDGTGDRLLLSSKETGVVTGFRMQSEDSALAGLVFDPQNKPAVGMATEAVQYGQDAKARINGLAVTSASNTLASNIPGVTIKLLATTTAGYDPAVPTGSTTEIKSPLTMAISEDVTPAVKNVNDFVTAYNTLNKSLTELTKYAVSTKTAGLFQGDSSVVGLQNILRNMLGSSSLGATSQRLSDVGLERQLDGSLTINTAKLSTAANNGTALQQLFTANNSDPLTNGFALKFRDLGKAIAATGGSVHSKAAALQKTLDTNATAQAKVTDHAALFETRLRKQYSALDAQMAQLNALNAYVTQQVATWNKSTA
ncbi:MAG: flagellar filament capping protein FliD [Rhodoferax sp.]|nr:flagellar filament capping protein FliD [Rhodoferax sp.]